MTVTDATSTIPLRPGIRFRWEGCSAQLPENCCCRSSAFLYTLKWWFYVSLKMNRTLVPCESLYEGDCYCLPGENIITMFVWILKFKTSNYNLMAVNVAVNFVGLLSLCRIFPSWYFCWYLYYHLYNIRRPLSSNAYMIRECSGRLLVTRILLICKLFFPFEGPT